MREPIISDTSPTIVLARAGVSVGAASVRSAIELLTALLADVEAGRSEVGSVVVMASVPGVVPEFASGVMDSFLTVAGEAD